MIWVISILVEENLFVAQVRYCAYSDNALYMLTSTVTLSIHNELLLQFWFIIYDDDDLHCLYKVITLIYLIINALFIMFNNIYAYMSISTTITIHLSLYVYIYYHLFMSITISLAITAKRLAEKQVLVKNL